MGESFNTVSLPAKVINSRRNVYSTSSRKMIISIRGFELYCPSQKFAGVCEWVVGKSRKIHIIRTGVNLRPCGRRPAFIHSRHVFREGLLQEEK